MKRFFWYLKAGFLCAALLVLFGTSGVTAQDEGMGIEEGGSVKPQQLVLPPARASASAVVPMGTVMAASLLTAELVAENAQNSNQVTRCLVRTSA